MENLKELIKNNKIVVFDLETSGLDKNLDYIIETGAVKIEGGNITDKFITFVNCPQMESLPKEVEELTGISFEQIKNAPRVGEVLQKFYDFAKGSILVAHNLPFDFAFLRNWGFWCGISFDEFEKNAIDTVSLAKEKLCGEIDNYKLSTIAKHFNIEFTHHRASDDAEATAKILLAMVNGN